MCLILLSWRESDDWPLLVAANRDEFHARSAAPARFWDDRPQILAGRDLQAGGTWMGVARNGRFAAVTNYRGAREPAASRSRGELVTGFLSSAVSPADYLTEVQKTVYSGFNLLACDGDSMWWMSNRGGEPRRLEPGTYGLGNLLLDSPEVEDSKARFRSARQAGPAIEPFFGTLAAARIVHPEYGTRCSTALLRASDGRIAFAERSYDPAGSEGDTVRHEFSISQ